MDASDPMLRHSSPQRMIVLVILLVAGLAGGAALYYAFEPASEPTPAAAKATLSPAEQTAQRVIQYASQGAYGQAESVAQEWIQAHPDDVPVRTALAQVYASTDRLDQAEAMVDKALAIDPQHPHACWTKGLLHAEDSTRAGAWFAKAATQPTAGARIWGEYGLWLLQQDASEQAGTYLQKAVDAGTDNASVYRALGQVRWQQGNADAAVAALKRSVVMAPRDARNWSALAEVHAGQGDFEQAAEAIEAGLDAARGPSRSVLHMQLGEVLERNAQYVPAAEAYLQATKIGQMVVPGLLGAARCYHLADQQGQAMRYIDRAYELAPEDPEIRRLRTRIENARFVKPGGMLDFEPGLDSGEPAPPREPAPTEAGDEGFDAPSFKID